MSTIISIGKWILIITGAIVWSIILILVGNTLPREVRYDCSIAEISPDYPREVVAECRRIKSGKSIST